MVLEIVSYFKLFQPEFFKKDEQEIIATMGLFFKQPKIESLTGSVFEMYHQQLKDEFGNDYTPMQADILKKIRDLQYFSFSAPTSTGKSFVFRHLITDCSNDVVVIVPFLTGCVWMSKVDFNFTGILRLRQPCKFRTVVCHYSAENLSEFVSKLFLDTLKYGENRVCRFVR